MGWSMKYFAIVLTVIMIIPVIGFWLVFQDFRRRKQEADTKDSAIVYPTRKHLRLSILIAIGGMNRYNSIM